MNKTYSCKIYSPKKAFACCFLILVAILALVMWLAILAHAVTLLIVGVVISFILPLVFMKNIRSFFTRDATLIFEEEKVTISIMAPDDDELFKKLEFKWENIRSYKFYFTPGKLCYLDIYFRKGRFREFGFIEDKTEAEAIKEESVFSIFRSCVLQHNSDKSENNKIKLSPGFLTTPTGTILMILAAVLSIMVAITYTVQHHRFNPFFMIGVCAFLPLVGKRQQDLNLFKRMKNLG
jgi:hypothetical protein